MNGRERSWGMGAAVLAALELALALHLRAAAPALWIDEIASVRFANYPVDLLWSDWMRRETNPPLYYSLLHWWSRGIGEDDTALRSMSFAVGVLGIIGAAVLARMLGGRAAGGLAALLVAASWEHVRYSQELRGYALTHTLALWALVGAVLFLDRERRGSMRWGGLALYAVATLGALHCHTTMVFFLALAGATVAAMLLARRYPAQDLATWVLANALVVAGWSWWLAVTWWQLHHATNIAWVARPGLHPGLRLVLNAFGASDIPALRGLATAAIIALALLAAWRLRDRAELVVPVIALAAAPLLFAVSQVQPVMLDRTLYWATGPALVSAAVALAGPWRQAWARAVALAAAAVLIAGPAAYGWQRSPFVLQDFRGAAGRIAAAEPAATVLVHGPVLAWGIERYCPAPACRFDLRTLPLDDDTFAVGMPRPGPTSFSAARGLLVERGSLWVLAGPDLSARLARDDMFGRIGTATQRGQGLALDGLVLTQWEVRR